MTEANNILNTVKVEYIDDDLLVAFKPQGIPSAAGELLSFTDMVLDLYPEIGSVSGFNKLDGGLLNRLDNETGGLILYARTQRGFNYYKEEMKHDRVIKRYLALCIDERKEPISMGEIAVPIAHHQKQNKKMVALVGPEVKYRSSPQKAVTMWRIVNNEEKYVFVEAIITKGVRHQIRVHLASIGLPIVNDKLYNKTPVQKVDKLNNDYHCLFCVGVDFTVLNGNNITVSIDNPFINYFE